MTSSGSEWALKRRSTWFRTAGSNCSNPSRTVSVMAAMNPSCTGQRSMRLRSNASLRPVRSAARQSSLRREPVEPLDHALALGACVPQNRRAAADGLIQPADLGGPAAGDERAEPALEGELDDLPVGEQLEQERLDLSQRGRPAEVHHHDA